MATDYRPAERRYALLFTSFIIDEKFSLKVLYSEGKKQHWTWNTD